MKLFFGILSLFLLSYARSELLIGAFNARVFGQAKINKSEVVQVLIRVRKYSSLVTCLNIVFNVKATMDTGTDS